MRNAGTMTTGALNDAPLTARHTSIVMPGSTSTLGLMAA